MLPPYIGWLKAKALGQYIREEGPASHATKASTPTMGGVPFMAATIAAAVVFLTVGGGLDAGSLATLAVGACCGLIGLVDDAAKFRRKSNAGISAPLRLSLELGLGVALAAALYVFGEGARLLVPATAVQPATAVMVPWVLFVPFAAFIVAASANALNLHDGMDGLAAGTAIQVLATLAFVLFASGQWTLAAVGAAAAGSIAGFLLFNRYPARIFMGDTGSLFIGGLMGALTLAGGLTLWFVPLALVYIVETLSVMIQVTYFKLTKDYQPETPMAAPALVWLKLTSRLPGEGKRFFRMAPLHHHFEAIGTERGVPEWQVVLGFWLAQLALCLTTLLVLRVG